jgi:catechol 2,3-dioxygenase-like lactoylglutathione lyase family enzyme
MLCVLATTVNGGTRPPSPRPGASASEGLTLDKTTIEERGITVITDLGHPAFAAHDVDATLGFYKILGIEEAFRLNHDDGSLMLVYLHVSGDRFIEVFPGGPPPRPKQRAKLRAHRPAYQRYARGRRASTPERRAHRPRAPRRPRRQPLGLDARPRRKPDRTNATLRESRHNSKQPALPKTAQRRNQPAAPGQRRYLKPDVA